MKTWAMGVLMALNQLANALLGGDPDMSVSARAGYARAHGAMLGTAACELFDWLDPRDGDNLEEGDHCTIAVRHFEEGRNQ